MPQFQLSTILAHSIYAHICPRCTSPMWLARIEPDEPGYEICTFECQNCEHSLKVSAKYR